MSVMSVIPVPYVRARPLCSCGREKKGVVSRDRKPLTSLTPLTGHVRGTVKQTARRHKDLFTLVKGQDVAAKLLITSY